MPCAIQVSMNKKSPLVVANGAKNNKNIQIR